jgi:hypothetical protein
MKGREFRLAYSRGTTTSTTITRSKAQLDRGFGVPCMIRAAAPKHTVEATARSATRLRTAGDL